jgi:hypothetical protein
MLGCTDAMQGNNAAMQSNMAAGMGDIAALLASKGRRCRVSAIRW